ncbi:MAG: nucleotidyl transferase AbiEii/AbiGii toxin family protein [Myxococcaceae bacterium]|nr:nucleotidyl transferase AbiEii/AbiGii toxin family protein [Myxococcaceae bacterium]
MAKGRLTDAQLALATTFFRSNREFFLTGGAVLAGWELQHRTTEDIDLFTDRDVVLEGERALKAAIAELGGQLEAVTTSPDFRRFVANIGGEQIKVDLVRDRAPQLYPKLERDGVRMDSAEEIFANKICTLVERSEVRDVVDLMLLEGRGLRVEDHLVQAQKKDGGATPATLAWLLSTMVVPAEVPGGVEREQVLGFVRALEKRMLALAAPR